MRNCWSFGAVVRDLSCVRGHLQEGVQSCVNRGLLGQRLPPGRSPCSLNDVFRGLPMGPGTTFRREYRQSEWRDDGFIRCQGPPKEGVQAV
jgi:hypothetical protein